MPNNIAEYPTLVTPGGSDVVKIVRVETMVNGSAADAVWPLLSVSVTFTLNWPATAGVPEITPVPAASVKPVGRPAAVQLYGVMPPVAVSVVEV